MAEVIKKFDVVAVQEVADNLEHFYGLVDALGGSWDYFYTDIGGNAERLGYLYNESRVRLTGLAAELAMRRHERERVTIDDVTVEGRPAASPRAGRAGGAPRGRFGSSRIEGAWAKKGLDVGYRHARGGLPWDA